MRRFSLQGAGWTAQINQRTDSDRVDTTQTWQTRSSDSLIALSSRHRAISGAGVSRRWCTPSDDARGTSLELNRELNREHNLLPEMDIKYSSLIIKNCRKL